MNTELLKKGFCPRQDLLKQAVRRGDNWPIVMLGDRINWMVYPGYYGDDGVTARVLWSSHLGKDVVTALVQATPDDEPQKEIHIEICDTPEEVGGDTMFSSKYYTVGLTVSEDTIKMMVFAEDLWTHYDAMIK